MRRSGEGPAARGCHPGAAEGSPRGLADVPRRTVRMVARRGPGRARELAGTAALLALLVLYGALMRLWEAPWPA